MNRLLNCNLSDHDLIYPSLGTSFNDKKHIENDDDLDELVSELTSFPHQKILQSHTAARLRSGASGIQIKEVLGMKLYLKPYAYDASNSEF